MDELRFASLFSGAGGLDIGFEQAGWACSYASDIDSISVGTILENRNLGSRYFADAFVEAADIRDTRGREILAKAGLRKGDLHALVGGPPCQSWSSAGHQRGFDDPRGKLFQDYVRVATELDTRWLVFENVRGLLTARGTNGEPGSALDTIRHALLQAGFQTEVNLLNAADFGVAQRRVRLFMIGFRRGDRPSYPEATHSRDADLFSGEVRSWVSLQECLSAISPVRPDEIFRPSPKLAEQLVDIPNGSGLKSPGKKESTRPGGHWGYKQGAFISDLALPARTVTASAQQDWIRDSHLGLRRLCPRECAAIQSFPSDWCFSGNTAAQYRQIGNAVPVTLAKLVATALEEHVRAGFTFKRNAAARDRLAPLRPALTAAIEYTKRDEMRNGDSRKREQPKRRKSTS